MGEDDTNNVVLYYGQKERQFVERLWGIDVLPRAHSLISLYGEAGGQGMFILDKGKGHGSSPDMNAYFVQFFKANRGSDKPVYPIPSNPEQLKYTVYN